MAVAAAAIISSSSSTGSSSSSSSSSCRGICVDMKLLVHLVTALVFDDAFIWHGFAAKTLYA
eukprot:12282-Heterococcus_DN1.PRE.1